jgi:uncharacterized protein YkwD
VARRPFPGPARIAALIAALAACALPLLPAAPAPSPATARPPSGGSYGPEPPADPTPLETRALDLVRGRFSADGARPQVSGALILAARALAQAALEGADPARRRPLRNALARALAYDPSPMVFTARAPDDRLLLELERALGPGVGSATHVGAGVAQAGAERVVVVLSSQRGARLDPFPRTATVGERPVLSGQLRAGLCAPRAFLTLPSGEVRPLPTAGKVWFQAAVPFDRPGRYVLEVLADGPQGPTVAALLSAAAGEASYEEPVPTGPEEPAEPADPARAEARVVEAISALRARHGLPPVEADPALSEVARRHSQAMRSARAVGHAVPGSPGPEARLRAARISYWRVFENVAGASSAREAQDAVTGSPAHLRNLLEPGVRRVGVGLVREELPSGRARVYLTEIFVEPAGARTQRDP